MDKKFKAEGSLSHWLIFGRIALIRMGAQEIRIKDEGWILEAVWQGDPVAVCLLDCGGNITEITLRAEQEDGLTALEEALDRQVLYPLTEEEAEIQRENHETADSLDVFERVEVGRVLNNETKENAPDDAEEESPGDQDVKNLPKGIQASGKAPSLAGKGWFITLLLVLALAVIAAIFFLAPGWNPKSNTTKAVATASSSMDSDSSEPYAFTAQAGNYLADKDFPVGSYTVSVVSGSGTIASDVSELSAAGPMALQAGDAVQTELTFNSVNTLHVSGTLTLSLTSSAAKVNGFTGRKVTDATRYSMAPGFDYTAGTDFPAGTYTITATQGNGSVTSNNAEAGGIDEIMAATGTSDAVSKVVNVALPAGTVLSVTGADIILEPSGD